MEKVVFVCTGNTCRSPMAEKIFNKKAEESGLDVRAESAGVFAVPGQPMTDKAGEVLREIGIEDTAHSSRMLTPDVVEDADYVLCMTESQRAVVSAIHECEPVSVYNDGLDVPDPYGGDLEDYREAARRIEIVVTRFLKLNYNFGERRTEQ